MRSGTRVVCLLLLTVISCAHASTRSSAAQREADALIDQWRDRDGEETFLVSDRLCLLMLSRPSVLLGRLDRREPEFSSWLDRIESASFRDFGDRMFDREVLLKQMIRVLDKMPDDPTTKRPRSRLLARLRAIQVSVVK
jgi:hypothetical protein